MSADFKKDKRIRREFAKAFGWYKKEPKNSKFGGYESTNKELQTPSWEQIFIKIGKLQANNNDCDQ